MNDQEFERKEKARLDAMYDAQFADEPTSDVDYADEPQINGWPLYSGLPQPIKPTQKQVIAWAREIWGDDSGKPWSDSALLHITKLAAFAYEAGRKDENEGLVQVLRRMKLEKGFVCDCGIEDATWELIEAI